MLIPPDDIVILAGDQLRPEINDSQFMDSRKMAATFGRYVPCISSRAKTQNQAPREGFVPPTSGKSMMILIAGPYRFGTNDDPALIKGNVEKMESYPSSARGTYRFWANGWRFPW